MYVQNFVIYRVFIKHTARILRGAYYVVWPVGRPTIILTVFLSLSSRPLVNSGFCSFKNCWVLLIFATISWTCISIHPLHVLVAGTPDQS